MNLLPGARQSRMVDRLERVLEDPGTSVWDTWASEGWFASPSLADQALLFRSLGRHAVPGRFLAQTLTSALAETAGASGLAAGVASGEIPVALALTDSSTVGEISTSVSGPVQLFDLPGSRLILLLNRYEAVVVSSEAVANLSERRCVEERTSMAVANLNAESLCSGGAHWWWRGATLIAAALAGIAEGTCDRASEHARTRMQFGRPIGMFQAVKHRCADMAIQAEAAWCQAAYAAMTLEAESTDTCLQVGAAKIVAGTAAEANAVAYIQTLGALGCTTDSDAHHYLKQSMVLNHLCGTRGDHRRLLLNAARGEKAHCPAKLDGVAAEA